MTTSQAIRTAAFAKLMAVNIISQLPGYFLLTHLVPYATDKGISPGAAAGAMGIMGLFNVLGRITLGTMAERIGWMKALSFSAFAFVLTTLWFIGVSELWMLYVYVMAYGSFWGGRLPPPHGQRGLLLRHRLTGRADRHHPGQQPYRRRFGTLRRGAGI